MITRRRFLTYAGATALAASVVPKLDLIRPFVTEDEPDPLHSVGEAGEAAASTPIRIAVNFPYGWGTMTYPPADETSRQKYEVLKYFAALGFTHTHYAMHFDPALFARNARGHWIYNGGRYREGSTATSLWAMKAAAESLGLRLVPMVGSLSWVSNYITLDPTISEWRSEESFRNWVEPEGLPSSLMSDFPRGRIAFVGNNPGMDDFFVEFLRIVKSNWNRPTTSLGGTVPEYYHMGQDDIGEDWCGCIQVNSRTNTTG